MSTPEVFETLFESLTYADIGNRWGKEYYFPDFCNSMFGYFDEGLSTGCFDLHNKSNPLYTDISLSNTVDRQWVCVNKKICLDNREPY